VTWAIFIITNIVDDVKLVEILRAVLPSSVCLYLRTIISK